MITAPKAGSRRGRIKVSKSFYHLSQIPLKELTLSPRLPAYPMEGEEQKTARICVATSISGCLLSINDERYCQEKDVVIEPFLIFHVYCCQSRAYYKPSEAEVGDVEITDEYWLKEPTDFIEDGRVYVSINQRAWSRQFERLPRPDFSRPIQ